MKISQRFDLEFVRRTSPMRRWRSIATWGCAIVALAVVAGFEFWPHRAAYWSEPLSPAHTDALTTNHNPLQNECRACHSRNWQPLVRMATGNDRARSVRDQDCQACHPQRETADHNPRQIVEHIRDCVWCHREHRSGERLAWVSDAFCTSCHANLQTVDGSHNFARQIASFAAHPEFAVHCAPVEAEPVPGERHHVHQVAVAADGRWLDQAALKFNHAAHMRLEGVLLPWEQAGGTEAAATRQLTCQSCHQPDADGAYMRPINFERHCRECHPLTFSAPLHAAGGPLPHTKFQTVARDVRSRLREIASESRWAEEPAYDEAVQPRLPHKPSPADPSADAAPRQQRPGALTPERALRQVKLGCARCHVFDVHGEGEFGVEVTPPGLPERWLPHSRFRHDRHSGYACIMCHAAPDSPAIETFLRATNPLSPSERQMRSESATDILMPSIDVCHRCHSNDRAKPRWASASSDCVTCHRYHQHHADHQHDPRKNLGETLRLPPVTRSK